MDDLGRLVISLDQESINALRAKQSKPGSDLSESVLRILQILSIAGAALWTLYTWIAFDERKNEFALKQADVQYLQTKLSIEETRLNIQAKQIAGEQLAELPVTILTKLESHKIGGRQNGGVYLVSYEYRITNVGASTITIDDILVDVFRGSILDVGQPAILNSFRKAGSVKWTPIPGKAYVFTDWHEGMTLGVTVPVVAQHGGGGTGRANPGETLIGSINVIVPGRPTDLVGFSVLFHADAPRRRPTSKTIETIGRLEELGPVGKTG